LRALEFAAGAEQAATVDDVLQLFTREIAQVGYTSHLIVVVDERDLPRRSIANGWQPQWTALYTKEKMTQSDPVHRHLLRTLKPFLWSEAPYDAEREPRCQAIMQLATDFRMTEGFCVPVHYDGTTAAVSIAGEKPESSPGVRSALHLMSLFAHNRLRALKKRSASHQPHLLTSREREVLQWVSAGKSDWDIGVILHISERTARAHVTNAVRKLNAVNRPAAVVEALRAGEISLNH
jgi:LuxR family quorum sensing-dependent transcriptional regulator